MSLGEVRYETVATGRSYRLSDGTELNFLGRDGNGAVDGVSVEEVLAVVQARLDAYRKGGAPGARYLSLAITDLESAENWTARWHSEVLRAKEVKASLQSA